MWTYYIDKTVVVHHLSVTWTFIITELEKASHKIVDYVAILDGWLEDHSWDSAVKWGNKVVNRDCLHQLCVILSYHIRKIYRLSHLMTKAAHWRVCPMKIKITLGICPVWSKSLLCPLWVDSEPNFPHVDSKDSNQTGWMARLNRAVNGCTCHIVGFVMLRLSRYMCSVKTQISLGICPVSSRFIVCWKKPPGFLPTHKWIRHRWLCGLYHAAAYLCYRKSHKKLVTWKHCCNRCKKLDNVNSI